MRKFKIYTAVLLALVIFSPKTCAAQQTTLIMAVNESVGYSNGQQFNMQAPMLVFDRMYVDLYAVAPKLGLDVIWGDSGVITVKYGEREAEFSYITNYSDLEKDRTYYIAYDRIFVRAREIADVTGNSINYENGILTFGPIDNGEKLYKNVSAANSDGYIYQKYPYTPWYAVNPYRAYGYEQMMEDAYILKNLYPNLIDVSSIGKSVEGRELMLIKFGRGDTNIFVCGAHHAREYITTTYLMFIVDRYAYAYRAGGLWNGYNVKELLDKVTFYIVPMVNPDGVSLVQNGPDSSPNWESISKLPITEGKKYGYKAWKANVHGVDLNWNYDKDWTIEKNRNFPGSAGFNGWEPNTEPETHAVSEYVGRYPFDAFISFHAQGQIFYWGDSRSNPKHIQEIIKKETGFKEMPDNGEGVGGSFFDYVYRKFDKPTFTFELCPYVGNYPYPDEDFNTVLKPVQNILLIFADKLKQAS